MKMSMRILNQPQRQQQKISISFVWCPKSIFKTYTSESAAGQSRRSIDYRWNCLYYRSQSRRHKTGGKICDSWNSTFFSFIILLLSLFVCFFFFVASTTTILEEIPFPLLAEEHIWIKSFRCWGLGWVEICIRRRASPSHYRLTIAHIFQMHRHVTQLPNSSEPKTTAFPAPRKSRKAEKFQRLNYSQWWRFSRDRVLP